MGLIFGLSVYILNHWGPIWDLVWHASMHVTCFVDGLPQSFTCRWALSESCFLVLEGTTKSAGHPQHSGALQLRVKAHWEAPSHWQADCLCWYVNNHSNCMHILEVDTLIANSSRHMNLHGIVYFFSWHCEVLDVKILKSETVKLELSRQFFLLLKWWCILLFQLHTFSRQPLAKYCWSVGVLTKVVAELQRTCKFSHFDRKYYHSCNRNRSQKKRNYEPPPLFLQPKKIK